MKVMLIPLFLFMILVILFYWYQNWKTKKNADKVESLRAEYNQLNAKSQLLLEAVKGLGSKEQELIETSKELDLYTNEKSHEINRLEQEIRALYDKRAILENSYCDYEQSLDKTMQSLQQLKKKELAEKVNAMEQEYLVKTEEKKNKIAEIEQLIEDKRSLIRAINQQFAEEQSGLQRIGLPNREYNTFKEAMEELQSSLPASFTKAMNKVLWTELVRQPTTDMVKKITGGERVPGIYKITNTKNGLAYIGRSVDVGSRLTEHVRSAVGASSGSQQQVHKEISKNLLDWEFELLERVPEEKLSEREKFYIDFYDTVNLGYNRARGG